jgi:cold shock CspA family protein
MSNITERERGRVRSWHEDKGFGFIVDAAGRDNVFFHGTAITKGTGEAPFPGDGVCFTRQDSPKGPRAVDVVFVSVDR